MQNGCGELKFRENFPKNMPAAYKKAITASKQKGNRDLEKGDQQFSMTYYLKDSVAFGKPISAIQFLYGYEWEHTQVFFKDSSFTSLRSQFKPPKPQPNDDYAPQISKNDATGWEADYQNMDFDIKSKSITCASGV